MRASLYFFFCANKQRLKSKTARGRLFSTNLSDSAFGIHGCMRQRPLFTGNGELEGRTFRRRDNDYDTVNPQHRREPHCSLIATLNSCPRVEPAQQQHHPRGAHKTRLDPLPFYFIPPAQTRLKTKIYALALFVFSFAWPLAVRFYDYLDTPPDFFQLHVPCHVGKRHTKRRDPSGRRLFCGVSF